MADTAVLHEPLFWLIGIPAVIILGLAKGGFSGIGTLATPLLALAMPPLQAAAIILPLIVQGAVGVWAFRHSWDGHVLKVMPRRLARDMFVGTTAIFFAAMNWMKVPAYAALGEFTRPNLIAALALLPVAIASTFAGVWLVRRVDPQRFYTSVYGLLVLVGGKLLWDAF